MAENKKDNYHILSLIGQGAYGHVYKARRKLTGQFVAIKSIKKKGKQQKDIKVMRDQIQILKKLKHQNIILLLDSFQTNSEFILVTQLGQGQLFNIIQDDQFLEEPEIRKIAQQLVRALHYIHTNRITHRDMKPQNILMTSDGVIKLCDFGFARHMSYKTQVLTSLKGTPLYMAPEVVKEEPYNHKADLWSLGVILYQLATGTPPFTAPNLITLVQHISKDPIVYSEQITGDFKGFLKGLLNKDPTKRLGWPQLLNHPFIKQTEAEKLQRKRKTEKFSSWVEENHYGNQQEEHGSVMGGTIYARSISQNGFQERSRDVSPKREQNCGDAGWNKYLTFASDEKGASALRTDSVFLDSLLKVLQTNLNQILRVKQKRSVLCTALKTLTQVMMKSKVPQNRKFDNCKNLNIPNHLLSILKGLLRVQGGRQFVQLIGDITKLIGLLGRSTFNKNFGIQMVYVRSFVPLLPQLVRMGGVGQMHQGLLINLLRTTGIFANNASANHIRSFSFYKDLVEKRFIQECMEITKTCQNLSVLKLFVQVLSAFMHPVYGDIQSFPWKRGAAPGVQEYKECSTMLQCVRQTIINSLLECDCGALFSRILGLQQEGALLPKISVSRITLQAIRQSKQFAQYVLFQQRNLVRELCVGLSSADPVVYGTACQIVSQLLRYCRQKKREKHMEVNITSYLATIFSKLSQGSKSVLNVMGSLAVLQELVTVEGGIFFVKIMQEVDKDKGVLRSISQFLAMPQNNKLQQMRKIQGSNYGIHPIGMYDSAFLFLHRLLLRIQKQLPKKLSQVLQYIKQSKLQVKIVQLLCNLNSKIDLSPRGLISLLMVLYDILSQSIWDQFAQEHLLSSLVGLLSQQQVETLNQWPIGLGGGEVCTTTMFGNLMKIFLVYLQQAEKQKQIVRVFYQQKLLELVINFTKHLGTETIGSVVTFILHLLAFDKGDTKERDTRSFVKQFIQANGMSLFVRFQLLKAQDSPASLIQSCNLLSQIARHSKQVYEFIDAIDPYEDLKKLICHSDTQIRSRILNLIGNMCRHSGYFYKKLDLNGILKQCIRLCEDDDKTIKKFACVAIGNASFHDDSLYQMLRPAIPVLVNLLKDTEEKTRSNAAAALGNLARNSALLDKDFIKTGANYQLFNMLAQDKSSAAKKVSIMAIINLLQLPESKKVLMGLQVGKILQKMLVAPWSSDVGLVKTTQKALSKLK